MQSNHTVGHLALRGDLGAAIIRADGRRKATGSLTEGAGANVFRTVGTNTVDNTAAVTEWA